MVGLKWNLDRSVEVLRPLARISSLGFRRAWAPYFSSPVSSVNLNQQPGLVRLCPCLTKVNSSSQHEVRGISQLFHSLLKAPWKGRQSRWVPRLMIGFLKVSFLLPLFAFSKTTRIQEPVISRNPQHQDLFLLLLLTSKQMPSNFSHLLNTIMRERDEWISFRTCLHEFKILRVFGKLIHESFFPFYFLCKLIQTTERWATFI